MTEENEEGFTSSADDVAPTPPDPVHVAVERAKAVLLEEAAAASKAAGQEVKCEPWTFDDASALAALAVRVDPENAPRWLLLAHRIGAGQVVKMLGGGVRSLRGLGVAEKAVAAELERGARDAGFLEGATIDVSQAKAPVPLLKVDGKPWLPGGIVGLVVAGGGTGKTTWLAELAVRVAHGKDWQDGLFELATQDHSTNPVQGDVLLVAAEEDVEAVHVQIKRGCMAAGVKPTKEATKHIHVWAGAEHHTALGVQVQLEDPVRGRVTTVVPSQFHDALCRKALDVGPLLVVLDPINQLLPTGGSENDAVTAGALIRLAGEIRAAAEEGRARKGITGGPRPVVLLAHHVRKPSGEERKATPENATSDDTRGSTAFVDNARWACRMSSLEEGDVARVRWTVTKVNGSVKISVDARKGADEHGMTLKRWTLKDAKELETAKAAAKAAVLLADQSIESQVDALVTAGGGTPKKKAQRKPPAPATPAPFEVP